MTEPQPQLEPNQTSERLSSAGEIVVELIIEGEEDAETSLETALENQPAGEREFSPELIELFGPAVMPPVDLLTFAEAIDVAAITGAPLEFVAPLPPELAPPQHRRAVSHAHSLELRAGGYR
jgi:hypothetical protein